MVTCPKCGNEIVEGKRFCRKCGTPVGAGAPQAPSPDSAPPVQERAPQGMMVAQDVMVRPPMPAQKPTRGARRVPWMLVGGVVGACAALVVVGWFLLRGGSPNVSGTETPVVLTGASPQAPVPATAPSSAIAPVPAAQPVSRPTPAASTPAQVSPSPAVSPVMSCPPDQVLRDGRCQPDWWCMCYREYVDGQIVTSTGCRANREACENLQRASVKGGKFLVENGVVKPCTQVPGEHPADSLGHRSEWQPSRRPGAWQLVGSCVLE
jgi:hypothetical protein